MGRLPLRLHPRLSFQYTAAGLFTHRVGPWTQMQIQVQHEGVAPWKTISTAELSPMGAFGYRQRLDRILQETHGRRVGDEVRQRLAGWIAQKYEKQHPEQGKVTAVLFGQTVWASNSADLANPSGHWEPLPPAGSQPTRLQVLSAYSIAQGQAQLTPMTRSKTL